MYPKFRYLLSSIAVFSVVSTIFTPLKMALADVPTPFGDLYTTIYPAENKRVFLNDLMYECSSIETNNCISEILIQLPDGSQRPLKFQKMYYTLEGSLCGPNCKKMESIRQGEQIWIDPVDNKSYNIRSALVLPGGVFAPSFFVSISQFGMGFKSELSIISFSVGLRLSKKFQFVSASLKNTSFSIEVVNGNYRYAISGEAIRQPQFALTRVGEVTPPSDHADYSSIVWGFRGTNSNALDRVYTDCKKDFVIFTSLSANELTPPHWDGSNISWELEGVHFWEDGEPIIGFYETSIPTYLFKCAFGLNENEIQTSITFVVSDDLELQTATHTVSIYKNFVNIKSFGFHFSKVKISMKTSAKKQIKTLKSQKYCEKGKSRKTPSRSKPLCPSGWKLSSK
jgi:hypothetical protein